MTRDARAAADGRGAAAGRGQAEILPRFRRLGAGAVRTKSGPLDLVTDADEAAERVIAAGLPRASPAASWWGRRRWPPTLRCWPRWMAPTSPSWSTRWTARRISPPACRCSAAWPRRSCGARSWPSWIHDPLGDDTAVALRGEGAWIESPDGHRHDLRVAAPVPVAEMVAAVSWGYMPEPLRSRVTARLPRLRATRRLPLCRA